MRQLALGILRSSRHRHHGQALIRPLFLIRRTARITVSAMAVGGPLSSNPSCTERSWTMRLRGDETDGVDQSLTHTRIQVNGVPVTPRWPRKPAKRRRSSYIDSRRDFRKSATVSGWMSCVDATRWGNSSRPPHLEATSDNSRSHARLPPPEAKQHGSSSCDTT